jgi:hypothetical protein
VRAAVRSTIAMPSDSATYKYVHDFCWKGGSTATIILASRWNDPNG